MIKGKMIVKMEEKIKRVDAKSRDFHIYTLGDSEREDRENGKDELSKE